METLNINPNRERTIIEDHVVETIPGEWRGNMYIEPRDVKVSGVDMYSIRNTEVEYDDGTIGYLSFGEMNEDWNPNLQREYRRIEEENNNLSFEPYTEGKNRPGQWRGNFYVEPTYERTVIPFEKEVKVFLIELILIDDFLKEFLRILIDMIYTP